MRVRHALISRSIRKLLRERGAGKSICPSEVARDIEPDAWRDVMAEVRAAASKLVTAGEIVVTQRGEPVDIATARGPIRLARADVEKTTYADAYRDIDFREVHLAFDNFLQRQVAIKIIRRKNLLIDSLPVTQRHMG